MALFLVQPSKHTHSALLLQGCGHWSGRGTEQQATYAALLQVEYPKCFAISAPCTACSGKNHQHVHSPPHYLSGSPRVTLHACHWSCWLLIWHGLPALLWSHGIVQMLLCRGGCYSKKAGNVGLVLRRSVVTGLRELGEADVDLCCHGADAPPKVSSFCAPFSTQGWRVANDSYTLKSLIPASSMSSTCMCC